MSTPTMLNPTTFVYRGITAKQNPLTSDWLVELGAKYGTYFCPNKTEVRKLIDTMFEHEQK
jgi:hypothetical protein